MTGRHARRPRPDIAAYMADGENSDLPGRPARYDPQTAADCRAGLDREARKHRIAYPPDPPTGRYRKPGRWARWRALLRRRFTPVKEEQ